MYYSLGYLWGFLLSLVLNQGSHNASVSFEVRMIRVAGVAHCCHYNSRPVASKPGQGMEMGIQRPHSKPRFSHRKPDQPDASSCIVSLRPIRQIVR